MTALKEPRAEQVYETDYEVSIYGCNYKIHQETNYKAYDSLLEKMKDFLGTAEGAFKCTDLCSKLCREGVEVARMTKNQSLATAVQGPGAVFSRMSSAYTFAHTAFAAVEFKEASDRVAKDGGSYGNIESFVQKALAVLSSGCYTLLQFIPGQTLLRSIATVSDLACDGLEIKMEATGWDIADIILRSEDVTPTVQAGLARKKTIHLLGLIKAVASVVGGIFAVLAMIYAAAIVPPIVSATIGLFVISMSFIKKYHEDSMPSRLIFTRQTKSLAY